MRVRVLRDRRTDWGTDKVLLAYTQKVVHNSLSVFSYFLFFSCLSSTADEVHLSVFSRASTPPPLRARALSLSWHSLAPLLSSASPWGGD